MQKKVVIILPTFNERKNIARFIDEVLAEEKNAPGWKFEILVVDSNSPDGTLDEVKKLEKHNSKIHHLTVGPGLGVALIEGHQYSIKHLQPDACAQLDADAQVKADVLPRMLKCIEDGYDLAIGSRFVPGGRNELSPSRRFFTWGSSVFCRFIMGPWNIKEFSNSARTFTPKLFKRMDLDLIPWQEKTFIIQPAFLNAAVVAGAKYKEVPLIFKNRSEGYSKMKTLNYIYDVITYAIDARFKKWGWEFPFFYLSRRAKTILKFSVVGLTGTVVDFIFYNILISYLSMRPATSKGISTEIAIINNFAWNHLWTFKHRKTNTNLFTKLGIFNLVSMGGLLISVLIVKFLHLSFGDGNADFFGLKVPFYNIYFFATIPPVMIWNFTVNHLVTWKNRD